MRVAHVCSHAAHRAAATEDGRVADRAIHLSLSRKLSYYFRQLAHMLLPKILAAGGLLFAFEHSTVAGKIVLALLCIVSVFSWSIMITKLRVVQFARKQAARFRAAFRKDRQPLRLFENHSKFPGAPLFNVYRAGCEEMTFQLLGSAEVDDTFRARLGSAEKIPLTRRT